jgi:hypothetical protein
MRFRFITCHSFALTNHDHTGHVCNIDTDSERYTDDNDNDFDDSDDDDDGESGL